MSGTDPAEVVVDARGLRCPLPVVRLAAVARSAPPGARVTVRWTDPAARHDIPAWARMRGHEVLSSTPTPDLDTGTGGTAAFATTVLLVAPAGDGCTPRAGAVQHRPSAWT